MGITYTLKQQQVINLHGCNTLVSAAAGSGKTAVLTERIVKMISDKDRKVDIDRLLVVTFTNAAAAEMRERIGAAIEMRLEQEPENEHLQKQSSLLHNAQITTIDSFCMFVIRNNFNDIGLDPGFRIADEGELKLLKQDVMEELLEEKFAGQNESFLHCVEYFSTGSRDKAIEENIEKLYQFAESYPWPEEWLNERKKDYLIDSVEELERTPYVKLCLEQIKRSVEDSLKKIDTAIFFCEQPDGPYMYAGVLEKEKERIQKLLLIENYKEGYELLSALTFERLPAKKDDSVSLSKREAVQQIRKEIKERIKKIENAYYPAQPETVLRHIKGCGGAVNEIIDLTIGFIKKLNEKKRENNIIDFSDMEHLALSILVNKTEKGYEPSRTARDYRDYFEEILIDEYQDSNLVQEYLLQSISGEADGNFNRFMVGDVKQSIYKFRMARPELFMEKYDTYEMDSGKKQRIDLHKNFRSRKEIVDSVNFIFAQIMGKELGGVAYGEAEALYHGAVYPKQTEAHANATELLLIKKDESEGKDVRKQEARAVARRIKELVGFFQVTDKDSGTLRQARYSDIVLLLRTTSGWDEDFKSVFKEEGIPAHTTSKTGYFAAKEIQTLLQFLQILDNPMQDIPLFGVMKSCFGGFDEEDIAVIKASDQSRNRKLYFALKDYAEGRQGSEEEILKNKAGSFLLFLNEYRDKTIYMPIHELMEEIIVNTGYMHYICALPGGEQRKANLEILLEKAVSFEKTSYYGLFHFIRYIEQLNKYDVDYGEANILDENADVIRIMSIHKSKGLEFPICFVCGLAKKFNMQDTSGRIITDLDMGIGADFVDVELRLQSRTVFKNMIAKKMKLDNLGEELRVLYVALTRAKEKLILTGMIGEPENMLKSLLTAKMQLLYSDLAEAGSYLDFILPAMAGHKSFEAIWEEYGFDGTCEKEDSLFAKEADIQVIIITGEDRVTANIREEIQKEGKRRKLLMTDAVTDTDNELMTFMSDKFSYVYQHTNLSDLYTKTTVSELKLAGAGDNKQQAEEEFSFHLYEEPAVIPYIPRFMKTEEALGGAGRGSAFHKVMELLDFKADVKEEIKIMAADGRLSREYADAVSVSHIEAFLKTGLAERMYLAQQKGLLYKEQPFVLGIAAKELNEKFPESELLLIQGIIDVWFEEDGELVVADYKTDKAEAERDLIVKYEKQLDYYARALEQLTGKRVKQKIIYSFGLLKEIIL